MREINLVIVLLYFASSCSFNKNDNKLNVNDKITDTAHIDSLTLIKNLIDSLNKQGVKPEITITTTHKPLKHLKFEGQIIDLSIKILDSILDNSPKKYTLIHCWATWCSPCLKELPNLYLNSEKLIDTDFILLSLDINTVSQKQIIGTYLSKIGYNKTVYVVKKHESKFEIKNQDALTLLRHYNKNYSGELPFNLLILNKKKKLIKASNEYNNIISVFEK